MAELEASAQVETSEPSQTINQRQQRGNRGNYRGNNRGNRQPRNQDRNNQNRRRSPITVDKVLPEIPKKEDRLEPPNQAAHDKAIQNIENQIVRLKAEIGGVKGELQGRIEEGKVTTGEQSGWELIKANLDARKTEFEDRDRIREELDGLQENFSRLLEEQRQNKSKIKIFDINEVNAKIAELNSRIELESNNLQTEKKYLADIKELEKSKPFIQRFFQLQEVISDQKGKLDALKKRLSTVNSSIKQRTELINSTRKRNTEEKEKMNKEIPELKEKRAAINNQIKELIQKKRQLERDFKQQQYDYEKEQKHIKGLEKAHTFQKRLIEKEKRKKEFEERIKESEETKEHPFAIQIGRCQTAIEYLQNLKSKQLESQADENAEEGETEQKGGKQGKRRQRQRKAPTAANVFSSLPMDVMNILIEENIRIPGSQDDLPGIIEALDKKREFYEGLTEDDIEKPKPRKRQQKPQEQSQPKQGEDFPEITASGNAQKFGIVQVETVPKPVRQAQSQNSSRRGGFNRRGRGQS